MDASCGPSSALSQLSKHAQRDTSLQHGTVNKSFPQQSRPSFKNQPGFDASLNQEFQNFSGRAGPGATFHDQFAGAGPINPHAQHRPQQHQHQQNQWIQDFNGLSLENRHQLPAAAAAAAAHAQQGKSDWHQQFMNLMNRQSVQQQQPQLQHNMANTAFRPQMGYMGQMGQMGQSFQTLNQPQTEKAQVEADLLENSEILDSHFEQLEKELAMEEQQSEEALISEIDKEQFVEAAKAVRHSMRNENNMKSEETTSKFEQLNFLKLMNSISDRKVELSKEGDKLVETETGQDIRNNLSDPLKYEKDPDYHERPHETIPAPTNLNAQNMSVPPPQITKESESVRSHLPDPLAHIKDGQLPDNLTALQAARIISGGQVTGNQWMEDESWLTDPSRLQNQTPLSQGGSSSGNSILEPHWQEVYDDYRHDDDYH